MKDKVNIKIIAGCEGRALLINDWRVAGPKPWGGGYAVHEFDAPKADILEALGRDVVEVVKCRDCEHLEVFENPLGWPQYGCERLRILVPHGHFCGYGERKEGGEK